MVLDSGHHDEPVHRVPVSSRVFVTEFSPFQWSSGLLAVGFQSSLTIGQCWFTEEEESRAEFQFDILKEIHHDTRVQAIAWSPRTSLVVAPKSIEFATSGTDHKLRIFSTDLTEVTVQVLKGHTDYINSLVFEPEKGGQVLTGSDDHTAKMWQDGKCIGTLFFKSPVMSVAWHQEDLGKVLVGQKSGIISLFNSSSLQPILSVDCGVAPLLSTDWSLTNSLLLTAAASVDLVMFDMSRPSLPTLRRPVHNEGARSVRISRYNDSLIATSGRPQNSLKISHTKSHQVLISTQQPVVGGFSWHLRLPYLAVGNDREISFYKVSF